MSFKKLQIISPLDIGNPEEGHIYFGRDNLGLWEKYPNGASVYVITGGTTGAGTSGSSGKAGSSGVDGGFYGSSGSSGNNGFNGSSGTSGSSGKSGTDGTSGSSGSSGWTGTSGTSGKTGSSGSSGSSGITGTNGSSGKDGNFYGSSGSSGSSGVTGGYGGSSRRWTFTTSNTPISTGYFNAYGNSYGFYDIKYIKINQEDSDSQLVDNWLNSWKNGVLKIEKWGDASIFGIYSILTGVTTNDQFGTNSYITISGLTCYDGNGLLVNGVDYLISYVPTGLNGSEKTFYWVVSNPVVGGIPGPKMITGITSTRVSSFNTDSTGVTFNIERRGSTTPNVAGTDILVTEQISSTSGTDDNSFNNFGIINVNEWLWLDISDVSGTPGILSVTLTGV